jgi:hypothetical protein
MILFLSKGKPAIDDQRVTGDVRGERGCEENGGTCHIGRQAHAALRNVGERAGKPFWALRGHLGQLGIDKAGREIGQTQGEIDKHIWSAAFATRHLENLRSRFVELAANAITVASAETKEAVEAPTVSAASVNEIGQFDAGCGKLK